MHSSSFENEKKYGFLLSFRKGTVLLFLWNLLWKIQHEYELIKRIEIYCICALSFVFGHLLLKIL